MSHVKVPPFSGCETAVVFACCVRDKLKDRPEEARKLLAHIANVTPKTLGNLLIGEECHAISFAKSLSILYALDALPDFWERLVGSATLPDRIRTATATIEAATRSLAEHPSSSELEEGADCWIELQRAIIDLAEVMRNTQKLRGRQRELNGEGQKLKAVD